MAGAGNSQCRLEFPATVEGCAGASAELGEALRAHQLDEKASYDAELVFEEIVANVMMHGSHGVAHRVMRVCVTFDARSVVMSFEDDGPPFDPRSYDAAPPPATLDEARPGGLGLLLVRGASTGIDYERTPQDRNRTTVTIARVHSPAPDDAGGERRAPGKTP